VVTDPPPPPSAGVAVQLSDSADPITTGDNYSYTARVLNGGPDAAQGISLSNTIPAGVSFQSAAPVPPEGRGSCSFDSSTGVVTCASLGSLASGGSFDVVISLQASTAGTKTNTATVASTTGDPNSDDNTDSESTFVQSPPPPPQPEQTPQQQASPPPPPPEQTETLDGCPTAARRTGNLSDGLLAFVPAAIQLEQRRRRRLSLVEDQPQAKKIGKRSRKSRVVKIVAVIAVLAVAAVVGVLLLTGGDKGKNYATLGGLEGRVDLQKPKEDFEPATKAATLNIGDKVRTGADGLARIDYTDGSLTRLDHNTTFQVQELINNDTHKSIKTNLDVGRVWHRVEKLTKQEDRFEVKTVTAVATVHGTTFVNDCRFNGGQECSHIGIEGTFGVRTTLGDQGEVSSGQC
jgi:uncharacterized repeat protein (TIGR01451 family)